jgi:threonylcarbamoyladenosine tRNA methylthiotransferase MtaB
MKAAFFTLGCKVNQYETAALQRSFARAGYEIVSEETGADVYVVNSCTVTSSGDRKSLQKLRRLRRLNPKAALCLCGCYPQAFPEEAAAISEADVVLGSKNRMFLLEAVERAKNGERVVEIPPHGAGERFEELGAGKMRERTRAFLKIEDGCDRHCAYCIVPKARGPVRSKPLAALKAELEAIAAQGCAEVVLTGVNLSCYGQDLGLRLIDAVRLACEAPGIGRVRVGSLEPELLPDEDIAGMSGFKKLCPHFHLSLQSGSDATLRRMGRMYSAAEYERIAESLRGRFPGAALTTDIIVGFPGETDAEFAESLAFCRKMGFAKAHVFGYSKRPGTAAAEMPGQISEPIKRERATLMQKAADETRGAFLLSQLNKPCRVLFETLGPNGMWEGYSENYAPVLMAHWDNLNGRILEAVPTKIEGDYCIAL